MASPKLTKNKKSDTMKKSSDILKKVRDYLWADTFVEKYRTHLRAFVRQRMLSIQSISLFILNLLNNSIGIELINFHNCLPNCCVSRSAICKARKKLDPRAFKDLNNVLVKEFYTDNVTRDFHGYTLAAIDGSKFELPINSIEISSKYGTASNQTEKEVPMALTSSVFDVLNGITMDSIIDSYHSSERDLAMEHVKNLCQLNLDKPLLLLFDRGYPSAELIMFLILSGADFLMRVNKQFLKETNKAFRKNYKEDFTFKLKASKAGKKFQKLKSQFPSLKKTDVFQIRTVVVPISETENEVLITTLLCKQEYPISIFKDLYFLRWGCEENYKFQKSTIEIENFSGLSCITVEQDFYASILTGNIYALLASESMMELQKEQLQKKQLQKKQLQKELSSRKYQYKVNKNIGLSMLKNKTIIVLLDPEISIVEFCNQTKARMKKNLVPIRPGRKFERKRKHPHRKHHPNLR